MKSRSRYPSVVLVLVSLNIITSTSLPQGWFFYPCGDADAIPGHQTQSGARVLADVNGVI
jgi:hypothetical protein